MKSVRTDREKGIIALVLLALVTASMGLFARTLSIQFTILQQVYLRVTVAFILGLIIFHKDFHIGNLRKISGKEWFLLFIRAVFTYLLGVTLFSQAVTLAKISNVSFFSVIPFVGLFGILFFKEKVTSRKIFYLLLGLAGVLLVAVKDYSHLLTWGTGEVLALMSSLCLAFSKVSRKWHGTLLNNKEIAIVMFFISAALIAGISFFLGEPLAPATSWPLSIHLTLLGAGAFNVAFLFLVNYGFEKVEAIVASNLLMLEALFAVILGFVFYRELSSMKEFIGGILIILSAYKMNKLKS